MIELGKKQTLTMIKKTDFGVYLADTSDPERNETEEVLLPKKEVPFDLEIMDPIEVFIYKDSKDRLIATTATPYIMLGESKVLTVKDVNNIGAFLDWGLEKDLLLPYKEQKGEVGVGDEVRVTLYKDKSKRLCATMYNNGTKLKEDAYERNSASLLGLLKKKKGVLPIGDKSSPEEIKKITGMSKNEFKKAAGALYKNKLAEISDSEIRLI